MLHSDGSLPFSCLKNTNRVHGTTEAALQALPFVAATNGASPYLCVDNRKPHFQPFCRSLLYRYSSVSHHLSSPFVGGSHDTTEAVLQALLFVVATGGASLSLYMYQVHVVLSWHLGPTFQQHKPQNASGAIGFASEMPWMLRSFAGAYQVPGTVHLYSYEATTSSDFPKQPQRHISTQQHSSKEAAVQRAATTLNLLILRQLQLQRFVLSEYMHMFGVVWLQGPAGDSITRTSRIPQFVPMQKANTKHTCSYS